MNIYKQQNLNSFQQKSNDEMSHRFLEMNKEELKMLKMMKPSSVL